MSTSPKFIYTLGVVALLTAMVSCRPSEDNQEYEPKVQRIEELTNKMAEGSASFGEMSEALNLVSEIAEVEEKEGKVLSSGQYNRIKAATEKINSK